MSVPEDGLVPGERRALYWELVDFSKGRGLEIGPLHRTIARRDEADVRYVDVHDQAGLREHYRGDPAVDPELIPTIDYVLLRPDGGALSLVEATSEGAPFSWVMASHVVEHVPDVIGWLADIAEIVEDGARLVLAVPDRRYCFDVLRPPTSVGQMIQAHLDGDTRPSVRAVYDYYSSVVAGSSSDMWAGRLPSYEHKHHTLHEADLKVEATVDGTYVDTHVWLWGPQGFVEQMHELRLRGRSAWIVERLEDTPVGDLEFRVVMRRLPRGSDTRVTQPGEVLTAATRPDWVDTIHKHEVERLTATLAMAQARLRKRRRKLHELREKAEVQRRRDHQTIEQLRDELDRVRNSRRWRTGRLALLPVRGVRRLRERRGTTRS